MPTMQAILQKTDASTGGPVGLTGLLKKHNIKSLGEDGEVPSFEGFLAEDASGDAASGRVEPEYAEKVDVGETEPPELKDEASAETDTAEETATEDEAAEIAVEDLFACDAAVPATDSETLVPDGENETAEVGGQATVAEEALAAVEETGVPAAPAVAIVEDAPIAEASSANPRAADLSGANAKPTSSAQAETPVLEKIAGTAESAKKDSSADALAAESKLQRGAEVEPAEEAAHDQPVRRRAGLEDHAANETAPAVDGRADRAAAENGSWNASAMGQAMRRETASAESMTARPQRAGEQDAARVALDIAPGLTRVEPPEAAAERPVADVQRMTPMNETLFVDTVLRQARLIERPNGDADMTISLKPEELGAVMIRLSLREDRLTAEVHVQTESARAAMADVIQRVKQALAEDGIELDQFNIGLRRDWRQHANQEGRDGDPERDRGVSGSGENETESVGPGDRVRAVRLSSLTGAMDYLA